MDIFALLLLEPAAWALCAVYGANDGAAAGLAY